MTTNLDFCIKAMQGALMLSRRALQVELAVGITVYATLGSTDLQAKKSLRCIYASAGQIDCLSPDARSYQTVNRRMDRCAKLYEFIGPTVIAKAIKGFSGTQIIDAIVTFLAPFELDSMDAVLDFIGEPRARPGASNDGQYRRASDAMGTVHLSSKHTHVDISPDASASELTRLANRLLELAATKRVTAIAA